MEAVLSLITAAYHSAIKLALNVNSRTKCMLFFQKKEEKAKTSSGTHPSYGYNAACDMTEVNMQQDLFSHDDQNHAKYS